MYGHWHDEVTVEWSNEPTLHYLKYQLRDTRLRRDVTPRPPRLGGYPPDEWTALLPQFGFVCFRHIPSTTGCIDILLEFLDESADIEVYLTVGNTLTRMSDPASRQRTFHICEVEAGIPIDLDVRQPSQLLDDDNVVQPDPGLWCTPFALRLRQPMDPTALGDDDGQESFRHAPVDRKTVQVLGTEVPPITRGLLLANWHKSLSAFTVAREGFDYEFLMKTLGRDLDSIVRDSIWTMPPWTEAVFAKPQTEYLILFSPRSGSTHLTELLCATGVAGYPQEFMTYPLVTSLMSYLPLGIMQYPDHVCEIFSTPNGVSGYEIDADRYFNTWRELLSARTGLRRIVFERQSFLPQAVSLYLATQFGIWHAPTQNQLERVEFLPDAFLAVCARLITMTLAIENHVADQPDMWLRVRHEDVVANPVYEVGRVLSWLGVTRYSRSTGLRNLEAFLESDRAALTPSGGSEKSMILNAAVSYLETCPRTQVVMGEVVLSIPSQLPLPDQILSGIRSISARLAPLVDQVSLAT